ncbi:hypothetical protein [Ramlibacter sp.]|uniref:hypothetical protein n=1 Tax=Ramlibacter sp. TaxID=1917967 RepID=UPI00257C9594|nr:hypothetical protein [Ramlibacter sp.]
MTIRFPTEAANADVMGEDPADTPGATPLPGQASPYARPRPASGDRGQRPSARATPARRPGPPEGPRPGGPSRGSDR